MEEADFLDVAGKRPKIAKMLSVSFADPDGGDGDGFCGHGSSFVRAGG
jgi:hypothetical protein